MGLTTKSTAYKPADKTPLDERRYVLLSSVQSLYERRAEVIITHAPSSSDTCETYAQLTEKPIVSLVPRLCGHSRSV
jgi:hypothetical protein